MPTLSNQAYLKQNKNNNNNKNPPKKKSPLFKDVMEEKQPSPNQTPF